MTSGEPRFPGTPVIILGMGRSGTSFLTAFLNSWGVNIGTDLIPPSDANPHGFYEHRAIVALHQRLLERVRKTPQFDDTLSPLLRDFDPSEEDREEAIRILNQVARPGLWGWKDPRTIHNVNFWLELLPNAKLIVPLRHPLEIAYSYLKRVATIDHWSNINAIFVAYAAYHDRIHEVITRRAEDSLIVYCQGAFSNLKCLSKLLHQFFNVAGEDRTTNQAFFEQSEFTKLRISHDLQALCDMLYPEASAAFNRLNQLAEFRFVPQEVNPAEVPLLAQLTELMRRPDAAIDRLSALPVILDLCRPFGGSSYHQLQSHLCHGLPIRSG